MTQRILVLTPDKILGETLQDHFHAMGYTTLACPPDQASGRLDRWGKPDLVVWDLPDDAAGEPAASGAILLVLLPEGSRTAPEGAAALRRPMDFEDLAEAVDNLLTTTPPGEEENLESASPIEPFPAEAARAEQGRRLRLERHTVRVLKLGLHSCWLGVPADFRTEGKITLWLPVPGRTRPLRIPAEILAARRQGTRTMVVCRFENLGMEEAGDLDRILTDRRKP